MITINGKNIIGVYIGNKPCLQVYGGVIPLCNDNAVIKGLEDFDYSFWGVEGDITYKDKGAIIQLYGDGTSWSDAYLITRILEKNKSYKVSFKCNLNYGKHTLLLMVGSESETYIIESKEQVIEKTFSNVSSNSFYIGLGYQSPSNNYNPQFTIKDFKIIEV